MWVDEVEEEEETPAEEEEPAWDDGMAVSSISTGRVTPSAPLDWAPQQPSPQFTRLTERARRLAPIQGPPSYAEAVRPPTADAGTQTGTPPYATWGGLCGTPPPTLTTMKRRLRRNPLGTRAYPPQEQTASPPQPKPPWIGNHRLCRSEYLFGGAWRPSRPPGTRTCLPEEQTASPLQPPPPGLGNAEFANGANTSLAVSSADRGIALI